MKTLSNNRILAWLAAKTWRIPVTLAVISAALQLGFIYESHQSPVYQVPIVDAASYHTQAMALASGQADDHRAFWQPPLYPYLLAGLYRTGTTDLLPVRCAHVPLGIAAVLLTFAIGRRCGGPWVGFAAGLGVCFHGALLFYFSQLLPTGLAVTLNLCGVLLFLRFAEKPVWPRAFALGLVAGIATLTVANSAVLTVVALGWIVWKFLHTRGGSDRLPPPANQNRRSYALAAVGLVAGFTIVILPVTIRNYIVSGEFVPVSTNGGINLFIGNNPHIERTLSVRPGMDWGRLVALPYHQGAKTDVEAENYFLGQVRDFIKDSPLTFLTGLARKAIEALGNREIPRNEDLYAFADYSHILHTLIWRIRCFAFPFGVIGPLAILGAVLMTRRHTARSLLLLFAIGYFSSVILFFPSSRYLAPVIPAMLILAVLGFESLAHWPSLPIMNRRTPFMVLAGAILLVNLPRPLTTDRVNYAAELHTYVGVGLQTRGRVREALEEYRLAIKTDPNNAEAHHYLGTAYRETGETALAASEFERTLVLRPDHDGAMQDLAVIRFQQGHIRESIELLRMANELNPDDRQIMINLGVGLMRLNLKAEAAEWLKRGTISQSPSQPASRIP